MQSCIDKNGTCEENYCRCNQDELSENNSNKNIMKEMARQLGSRGGKKSVQSRFKSKSKKEISEMMKKVRKGKFTESQDLVDCLNCSVLEEQQNSKP